ncbi:cation-translocating P-type ATPase [Parasphingorhabdus pacifica]
MSGLGWLLSTFRGLADPVSEALRSAAAAPGDRRSWAGRERAHVEVKGIHLPGTEHAATELIRRLAEIEGVRRATINSVLGRAVVERSADLVSDAELARVISEFEVEHGLDREECAPTGEEHPANGDALLREVGALGVSLLGVGYAAVASLLPVRGVSPLVPATVSLVDSVPWLRSEAVTRLGSATTDTTLALGGAVSQSLSGNPLPVLTDACGRFCSTREVFARNQAWRRWEAESELPVHDTDSPGEPPIRPRPLPDGPVERVSSISGGMALAGYGTVLAATRDPRRSLAALLAGVPRPAKAGREAFAAQLAVSLCGRDGLIFDRQSLRRLDRVDTVVLDPRVLLTGQRVVDNVFPADPDADPAEMFERANELLDPDHPERRRAGGDWTAAPLTDPDSLPKNLREVFDAESRRGANVVGIHRRDQLRALVAIVDQLQPFTEALLEAADSVGEVVISGEGERIGHRLISGHAVAGGRMTESVRQLQEAGQVVAVVSAQEHQALSAADLGIGLARADQPRPWGADLICPDESVVHTLLLATDNARTVSRYAAGISTAASCLAAAFGALGPSLGAPTRASVPMSTATLLSLAMGTWSAVLAASTPPPVPRERTPWHTMPITAVLGALSTTRTGLSERSAAKREPPMTAADTGTGWLSATLDGLITPITPVLAVGAVVSAAVGSTVDAVLIGGVLLISALIEGLQRVATDRELARLLDASQVPARLLREGRTRNVPADQLVPGDIVELHAGDAVPADCRLVEADGVEADESSLTGESNLVGKAVDATVAATVADRTCMLYQGTVVATGNATGVVVATGRSTELGRTTQENGTTPDGAGGVDARLAELTKRALPLSVCGGAGLLVLDLLRGVPLASTIGRSVGLAVAAVPEGLPFVATLAELAAAHRLSGRGVLVRRPATIEALGRVDALCFDKTGTLTQGRIQLREVSDGLRQAPLETPDPWCRRIVTAALAASPRQNGNRPLPHPTDRAVLAGADDVGIRSGAEEDVVAELPFEPSRGFHAVLRAGDGAAELHVKGAPEVVLDRCVRWQRQGEDVPFDAEARARVEQQVERLALQGYRLLAVAERTHRSGTELDESDVDGLVLLGLLGLADPVHPTAAQAVARLHGSGIDAVMITGDHPSTAEAIAAELNMLGDKRVMHGAELEGLDDDELCAELPTVSVFARVTPAQKARIVRLLRSSGRVVAMTGDGVNDVPAIKLAHVGIALGERATPAARETADLVVADDRIETLTDAIVEGRGMWASVRDALAILLGGNLGEIGFSLGAGLLGRNATLNARQLLVVNMLTDVLPATAIAVRPPSRATPESLLAEGPDASLGKALTHDVYLRAGATAGAAGLAWLLVRPLSTAGQARTTGLVALVSAQLAQTVAMRGRSPLVLLACGASLVLLAAIVQVPGISHFFGSSPLLPHHWAVALGSSTAAAVLVAVWHAWPGSRPAEGSPAPARGVGGRVTSQGAHVLEALPVRG